MFFSAIIPVYNRPEEIDELLDSLIRQTYKNFEVIIVDDGSTKKCDEAVKKYEDKLDVKYFYKKNEGQGFARNYGFERAKGDYFVIFDSDCVIPENYFEVVYKHLNSNWLDAYGGPDKASENFTAVQKAINNSMTSFLTTGGIRGSKKRMSEFHPRSFNMGISRKVYETTGGFILPYSGEDIEFSMRVIKSGFKTGLIEEAFVYHKRRATFAKFFKQTHFFGKARINVYKFHKEGLKLAYFFPSFYFLYAIFCILSFLFLGSNAFYVSLPLIFYNFLIFIDGVFKSKSVYIGFLTIVAANIQLIGYGIGFIQAFVKRIILSKN